MAIDDKQWNPDGIIVIDTEAPSLETQPFAVAAVIYDHHTRRIVRSWTRRCPTPINCNEWVKEHVLPVLDHPKTGIPVDTPSYTALCDAWRRFYGPYRRTHPVMTHVSWPLESRFLHDAHRGQVNTTGPYPLLDLATTLYDAGRDPRSVDAYLESIRRDVDGIPHHPLHDARVALEAWLDLTNRRATAYRRAAWHPMTWFRRARCPPQDLPSRQGLTETLLVDHGRKIWRCTRCGHIWSI